MSGDRVEVLVILNPKTPELANEAKSTFAKQGAKILHSYGNEVMVLESRAEMVATVTELPGVLGATTGRYLGDTSTLDATGQLGIAAWNQTRSPSFREAKRHRKNEGLSWDVPDDPGES